MSHHLDPPYTWMKQSPGYVSDTELALLSSGISNRTLQRPGNNFDHHWNQNLDYVSFKNPNRQARYAIPSPTKFCESDLRSNFKVWKPNASKRLWRSPNLWFYHRLTNEKDDNTPDDVHRRGWRKVVAGAVLLAILVFLSNLSFTIYLMLKFGSKDGVGEIFQGDCVIAKRWNTGIHLLINILSTLLLGAGNYTMQCLSAPNRAEVDAAHSKGISLDIGILSVRNFLHMRPLKGILWLCLCLSTIPLAFLWNSAIFLTGAANSSSYLVVDPGFLSGSPYQRPLLNFIDCGNFRFLDPKLVIDYMYDQYQTGRYVNMSSKDCFYAYSDGDGTNYRNLILVTTPNRTMQMSKCGYKSQNWSNSSVIAIHNQLIQNSTWPLQSMNISLFPEPSVPSDINSHSSDFNISERMRELKNTIERTDKWNFGPYPVDYCFAEQYKAPCKLQFASFILYTVVVCNFIKIVCMSITVVYLWDVKHPSLATVGDAVAAFLDKPDEKSANMCLIDHYHMDHHGGQPPSLEYSREPTKLLHNVEPTRRKWTTFGFGYFTWCIGTMLFLSVATQQSLSGAKFGAVSQNALLDTNGDSGFGLFVDVLIANSFQVVFSTVYVFYNSTLTARWGAFEWASYIRSKLKSLRVTWPQGQQRSTYFLQLPWKYGVPLMGLQVAMHFFISQSIFLARLIYYDTFGNPTNTGSSSVGLTGFSTVGYSNSAALTTFLCWTVVCIAVLAGGFVKVDNRIPTHGNRSLVISALCHAKTPQNPSDREVGRYRLSTRPLMWGVTREPEASSNCLQPDGKPCEPIPGHCAFTDKVVELPQIGLRYA